MQVLKTSISENQYLRFFENDTTSQLFCVQVPEVLF